MYGGLTILNPSNRGRLIIILGLAVKVITSYPYEIKAFEQTDNLSFSSKYFLLFSFLWLSINCFILPQVRVEKGQRTPRLI
jgi:hypothetical protein